MENIDRGDLVLTQEGYYGIVLIAGDNPDEIVVFLGNGIRSYELKEDCTVVMLPNGVAHTSFQEVINRGQPFFM